MLPALILSAFSLIIHSSDRNVGSCTICTPIQLDTFALKTRNSLGGYASDDGTMQVFKVESNKLTLQKKPAQNSYYYTKITCLKDLSPNSGLEFEMTIPAGASFTIAFRIYKIGQSCGNG